MIFFFSSVSRQATKELSSLQTTAKCGFQGNKPLQAVPQDFGWGEVFALKYTSGGIV